VLSSTRPAAGRQIDDPAKGRRKYPDKPGWDCHARTPVPVPIVDGRDKRRLRREDDLMTMPDDMRAHNRQLIADFRADEGRSMAARPLLLLTTTGRRSGQERTTPMMYARAGDRLFVIASNNGAERDPHWYLNLVADPDVTVEMTGEKFKAKAIPLSGDDYAREWSAIKASYPFFEEHEQKAGRPIPVVSLIRQ
jgi:deazaflavin-dependent oxidoreductase (nitroreductase family)